MKTPIHYPGSKLIHSPQFNPQFPETYTFELLDSHSLSTLGVELANAVKSDLATKERNLVAGLRVALNRIAEIAKAPF